MLIPRLCERFSRMGNVPELLLQQAEKNELVVFVGAGVSRIGLR